MGRKRTRRAQATEVYEKVREATASSLGTAGRRLRRRPEPPKHTGRKLAMGAAVATGAAYAITKRQTRSSASGPEYDGQRMPTTFPDNPVPTN
jgi:hypothetical protein